jgi:diguanylate cyclase (GGDEF)-like protein
VVINPLLPESETSPIQRVLEITRDILQETELGPALDSIARGVRDLYGFRYVTIVAADATGLDLSRRVLLGYSAEIVAERQHEIVRRADILEVLDPSFQVHPDCYYIPTERAFGWERAIYTGDLPLDATREAPNRWHENDALVFVFPDRSGEMLGYISVDGPLDGNVPSDETMRSVQLFVNLLGLALANARAHAAEIERGRLLEASQAKLRYEATHDALTRLPNRTYFAALLEEMLRTRGRDVRSAVFFVDLDEFKSVNDSLGHAAGDALLVIIAQRLRATVSDLDVVARFGGDEFAILVRDRSGPEEIEALADAVHGALLDPLEIDGRVVYTTASIGIAIVEPSYVEMEAVLRDADTAMYHAKSQGRARHAFFDSQMHTRAAKRLGLVSDLRAAIDEEAFDVDFQPIVALASGKIVGLEALVRWPGYNNGAGLAPLEFVPVAEEVGLISKIGRFVLARSCEALAEWQRVIPGLGLSVNLAVQEILQPDIDAYVLDLLRRFGLRPQQITLEITETAIMRSGSLATSALERLRATGVRLCIDDFGTGYSSLRYLQQFTVNAIKIDRSFVAGSGGELASEPIVRMLVELAASYGADCVAEGVETAGQSKALHALRCTFGQGYFFNRPLRRDAVAAVLGGN